MKYLIVLALCIYSFATVRAATFTVDSTADDGSVGTLRWALEQHLADASEPNAIDFDPSLAGATIFFTESSPNGNFAPVIAGTLTIDASAAPGLAIDRNGGARIFLVNNTTSFTLRNIKLQNSDGLFGGGCIRASNGEPQIVIENVTFENCEQRSTASVDALGGAILADFDSPGAGSLTVRDSLFISNRVYGSASRVFGGAIYASSGSVLVERSTFELNTSDDLSGAFSQGGAIFISNSDVVIQGSTFNFNQAPGASGGAVVINNRETNTALVQGNLFAGNVARLGAGLWVGTQALGQAPPVDIAQNTFLANTSDNSFVGGAVYFREGAVRLRNNSFIDNENSSGGGAHIAYSPSDLTLVSVWNNLFDDASTDACSVFNGLAPVAPLSAGYNVVPDTSCSLGGTGEQVVPTDAFFQLTDYGAEVRLVAPRFDNPAIDAGNPLLPDDADWATCLERDARGLARSGDGDADGQSRCDIGAFEWPGEAALFLDGYEEGLVLP